MSTGIAAAGEGQLPGDLAVSRAVQRLDGQPVEWLVSIGNTIGSTVSGVIVITLMIIIAALWGAGKDLVFLVTLLGLRLLAVLLKPVFESPRPSADLVTIHGTFDGSGFPSGHALTAATLALGLSIIAWRWTRHRNTAMVITVALMLLALLVGLARVWSGAHWSSDVVGGYCFAIVIVALAVLIRDRQRWVAR